MERKVYVPNKSFHDFSDAEKFGKLIFLTEGIVRRTNINQLYRQCMNIMQDATIEDYLLISSLGILNAIPASILAHRFARVNYLMYTAHGYVARTVSLNNVPKEDDASGDVEIHL